MLENKTILSRDDRIEATLQLRKKSTSIFMIVISIVISVEGLFLAYMGENRGIFFFVAGIFIFILSTNKFSKKSLQKRIPISAPNDVGVISHYIFYSDQLQVHEVQGNEEILSVISIHQYTSFRESKDYIYLIIDRRASHILKKDAFVQGTVLEFKEYMRNHGIIQRK